MAPARFLSHFDGILASIGPEPGGEVIGESREGRPITAFGIGDGPLRINLVGGCHADEPVGPRLLWKLVQYLRSGPAAPLREAARWSVIPHLNPDGAQANAGWQEPNAQAYDSVNYLSHRVRELPGDDIEFGFPRSGDDTESRPENRAADAFWRDRGPFHLHVSLHGMGVAAGPYFLVERSWWPRFEPAADVLAQLVEEKGYALHDVERHGEKGFHRLAKGFCSRPDSRPMRDHFLGLGDPEMAARFRPSSMEAVRAIGGDPLTLVTEMPLFLTPGVGAQLGPPDPHLMEWRARIAEWEERLRASESAAAEVDAVRMGMGESGFTAMPVADQMFFQWAFICAGIGAADAA
ncbi:MAG: M14 family zinc carboxypeptidase [Longimicrobiales bacterium]